MPGGDRTGPAGLGPMTGRARGYCAGYQTPGSMSPVSGRGFRARGRGRGWGRGGGRGLRNWFHATGLTGWQRAAMGWLGSVSSWMPHVPWATPTMTSEQEVEVLKGQATHLEGALRDIKERLAKLETRADR